MTFTGSFLNEVKQVASGLDHDAIEKAAELLAAVRSRNGRLFILGVGGSAASASHAVNDFRKIAGLEAYTPIDNVSELTARTNDEGWTGVFRAWLECSKLCDHDAILILSVGGGDEARNVSVNLIQAIQLAKQKNALVVGIVGRDGGYTKTVADACIMVPTINPSHVTPHTESFHSVICHLLVSHPALKQAETKWESVK